MDDFREYYPGDNNKQTSGSDGFHEGVRQGVHQGAHAGGYQGTQASNGQTNSYQNPHTTSAQTSGGQTSYVHSQADSGYGQSRAAQSNYGYGTSNATNNTMNNAAQDSIHNGNTAQYGTHNGNPRTDYVHVDATNAQHFTRYSYENYDEDKSASRTGQESKEPIQDVNFVI
ncbi:MAG: hypothetical protein IKU18_04745, partial [Bacteroidales bacterium]|nr:hypothetical protein [Bacteroidales bacterium]